jgi:hypothetical protein
MASLSELYFSAEGLANTKGVDQFKKIMTIDRARRLYLSVFESKGYAWIQDHFVEMLVNVAGREQRANDEHEPDEYPGGYSDYGSHQQSFNRRGGCST